MKTYKLHLLCDHKNHLLLFSVSSIVLAFVGTDTTGCVRIPAAFCGILGFRPSHGVVSTIGVLPNAQSLDTVGMMLNCVIYRHAFNLFFHILRGFIYLKYPHLPLISFKLLNSVSIFHLTSITWIKLGNYIHGLRNFQMSPI